VDLTTVDRVEPGPLWADYAPVLKSSAREAGVGQTYLLCYEQPATRSEHNAAYPHSLRLGSSISGMAHWNNAFAVALLLAAGTTLPRELMRIVTGEDATAYPFLRRANLPGFLLLVDR